MEQSNLLANALSCGPEHPSCASLPTSLGIRRQAIGRSDRFPDPLWRSHPVADQSLRQRQVR